MSTKKGAKGPIQFEETYSGFDSDSDDALNEETFGRAIPTGDFNFGGTSSSNDSNQPALNFAQVASGPPTTSQSFDQFQDDPLKPMQSLWGGAQSIQGSAGKVLSVDEIEAQLQSDSVSLPHSASQFQQQDPIVPSNNFFYPPGYVPQSGVPPNIPPQFNLNQLQIQQQQQQFSQLPPQVQQQIFQSQSFANQQNLQYQNVQQSQNQYLQGQPQPQAQGQVLGQPQLAPQLQPQFIQQSAAAPAHPIQEGIISQKEVSQYQQVHETVGQTDNSKREPDLSQFPVLGSEEAKSLRGKRDDGFPQQHQYQQQQYQQYQQSTQTPQHQQHTSRQHNRHHGSNHVENFNELTPEERERLINRQQKLARIVQFSGIMTPRDKDFVTRVHLSKIVSDDPYAEDFYYQVYKVLKTGGEVANFNSIAQNYLDYSGHRLGGRHQRADVALQRMQQQVQKAVTVAKERAKASSSSKREGALGKFTSAIRNNKNARTKLELPVGPELPTISQSGKQAVLTQIELIYDHVLTLESEERKGSSLNTEELWDSLKLFDNSNGLNPFIQLLSYSKGLKVFPRIFHFLDREQKLTIITLLFANLSLIKIISKSSFKNYKNDEIPEDVSKTIELFRVVVLKPIVMFLSYEAVLNEIIGLLTILVERNNVSFLSTSQLGLSLITILLSRAELIKQEQTVSTEDLHHWSAAYDKLFSSLETKLSLIVPSSSKYDDSYIWQFLASLALSGKLNHQRIIVDEIRDSIFNSIKKAKESDDATKVKTLSNLNLLLNVMGLYANEDEIMEMKPF